MESSATETLLLDRSIVDPNGLNFAEGDDTRFSRNVNGRTYQRPPLTTFKGYQYAAYYDENRNVCLARRKIPDGGWETIRFTDYTMPGNDSHNVVTLGICRKDGTIHLSFDNHGDRLRYRVSHKRVASNPDTIEWNAERFGPVSNELGAVGSIERFTYPYFFNAPNGNLMLYYREGGSGNGNGMIQEYDGSTSEWTTGLGKFIDSAGSYNGALSTNSQSRNPYLNGISYAGNRIHATWGWRESSGGAQFNHDLCYAYSDDDGRTWRNNDGIQIGATGTEFMNVDSPGLVVAEIPQNIGLSNQYTHYAYTNGSCHVIVAHNQEGTSDRLYQHYRRDAEGSWTHATLPFGGSRPKLVGDHDNSLILIHTSGGRLRIAKGAPNPEKTEWTWEVVHTQSEATEGGEGQVDYTRWEQDRTLSVYGQEQPATVLNYGSGSPIDGLPSPVHVSDYHVSQSAIQPNPIPGSYGRSLAGRLDWTAGLNADAHRVYLGTDRAAVENATITSPEFMGQQLETTYLIPLRLRALSEYYWRIDSVNTDESIVKGPVWSFTTRDEDPSINPIAFGPVGNTLKFTYVRSAFSITEGVTHEVEVNDNLDNDTWSSEGVSQEFRVDGDAIQTVTASIPLPKNGRRFVRLSTRR